MKSYFITNLVLKIRQKMAYFLKQKKNLQSRFLNLNVIKIMILKN